MPYFCGICCIVIAPIVLLIVNSTFYSRWVMNNSNAQITPLDCLSILLEFKALLHIDENDQYSDCSKIYKYVVGEHFSAFLIYCFQGKEITFCCIYIFVSITALLHILITRLLLLGALIPLWDIESFFIRIARYLLLVNK